MIKNILSISFFLLFTLFVQAQSNSFFSNYDWEENPEYSVKPDSTETIIELKNKVVNEFFFDKDDNLLELSMEHRVLWLNSDEKIESFNKVYLPYSSTSELLVNKARVITKNGAVRELDDSKILMATDEETGRKYKYFAFEGIEKGSFIEYYYVVKQNPTYRGKRVNFQTSFKKENVEFDLFAPSNLVFKFKSYNGAPEVEQDTLTKDKNHWKLRIEELKGLEEEELSAYDASKAFVIYKLDENLAGNVSGISSYGNVSQNIYAYYYPEHSKRTQKAIDKFASEAVKGAGKTEESILRKIEYYIKTNVYVADGGGDELEDLDKILDQKVANGTGIVKLYAAVLKSLEIPHEVVFTSNRQNLRFDKIFEANNFLTDCLLYFPNTGAYISPEENSSRYGFPPAYLTDNYGLFVKEVTVGNFTSAVGEIKYIEPVSEDKTIDKMTIDVDFEDKDLSTTNIKLDRAFSGYYGMFIHPFIHLVKEESLNDFIEGFGKRLNENVEIVDKKLVNDDPELFGIEPLEVVLDIKSNAFIEKAGNRYLFKVGELIGQQIQLYQEKERVLPLENEFKRSYYRNINIEIPKGYRFANLDDINIDKKYSKDGKEILSFNSFYNVKDGIVHITADEHYRVNIIETARYEDYRDVINSAADFNKLTLILEPEE
ncbi:DUF3857 domain-containing protein [Salegentibacter sp. F188]|uniref:DUF3857 domain-containing protein n=1 Tax=Autumnicola patrickiae TaxID=3075591 RepID=A0ABU3E2N9_9FLAO|nr:DUF3857 domain-containing protein [Salegentibacter sp. F188]MDT0690263.1 DUF3857 domain-containing protein [Salegentibacter sp. F188]